MTQACLRLVTRITPLFSGTDGKKWYFARTTHVFLPSTSKIFISLINVNWAPAKDVNWYTCMYSHNHYYYSCVGRQQTHPTVWNLTLALVVGEFSLTGIVTDRVISKAWVNGVGIHLCQTLARGSPHTSRNHPSPQLHRVPDASLNVNMARMCSQVEYSVVCYTTSTLYEFYISKPIAPCAPLSSKTITHSWIDYKNVPAVATNRFCMMA